MFVGQGHVREKENDKKFEPYKEGQIFEQRVSV